MPLIDEGLAWCRQHGDTFALGIALGVRANAARGQGDVALAVRLFGESIAVAQAIGDQGTVLGAVAGLAGVALRTGQTERAARLLGAVAAAQAAAGIGRITHVLHVLPILTDVRQRLGDPQYDAASAFGRAMPLADAIHDALAVQTAAPDSSVSNRRSADRFGLSRREREILAFLCQRQTDPEIAEALFISPRTVNAHVTNLFNKLGVSSRRDAAALAARHGLA